MPSCQRDMHLIGCQYDMWLPKCDVLLIYEWYVNVTCSYFLKCVAKLSSVPYEWLLHHLCGWVGYVYVHTLWVTVCTFISYMHGATKDAFIPYMHMDLKIVLNILVFKTSHDEWVYETSKGGFKRVWFHVFERWILNMWLKEGLGWLQYKKKEVNVHNIWEANLF